MFPDGLRFALFVGKFRVRRSYEIFTRSKGEGWLDTTLGVGSAHSGVTHPFSGAGVHLIADPETTEGYLNGEGLAGK